MIIPQERALEISIHSYRLAYNVTLNYKLHLWWALRIRNIKRALILYFSFFSFFFFANTPSPSGTFFTKQHTSACRKPTLFLCVYVRVCKRVNVCMRAEARLVLVLVQHLNPNSFWLQESQRSDPHSHIHTRAPWGWGVRGLGRHLLSMHVWIFYWYATVRTPLGGSFVHSSCSKFGRSVGFVSCPAGENVCVAFNAFSREVYGFGYETSKLPRGTVIHM